MARNPQSADIANNRAELLAAREALRDQIWTLENPIPVGGGSGVNWSGEPNPLIVRLKADLADIQKCIDDIDVSET